MANPTRLASDWNSSVCKHCQIGSHVAALSTMLRPSSNLDLIGKRSTFLIQRAEMLALQARRRLLSRAPNPNTTSLSSQLAKHIWSGECKTKKICSFTRKQRWFWEAPRGWGNAFDAQKRGGLQGSDPRKETLAAVERRRLASHSLCAMKTQSVVDWR